MKTAIVRWFLGGIFREVAEGKRGEQLKRAYWWLSGRKRTWSAIAGLLFAGLTAYRPDVAVHWAPAIVGVLGFMVTVGLADKDWKVAPPPVEWATAFHEIMSFGPVLSAAVAFLAEFLPRIPGCTACAGYVPPIREFAVATAAVTAWLAARFAVPPKFPMRRAEDLG